MSLDPSKGQFPALDPHQRKTSEAGVFINVRGFALIVHLPRALTLVKFQMPNARISQLDI